MKEETSKQVENLKRPADSVKITKATELQAAQKATATGSSEKEKSLSTPKIKIPADQGKSAPKKD